MQAEPAIGAFLPCGVALREGASSQETIVALQNPALLADVFGVPRLSPVADEALKRLRAALEAVGTLA